jgi:hypothetical protein
VTCTCATLATLSLFDPETHTREKQTRRGWHGWHPSRVSKAYTAAGIIDRLLPEAGGSGGKQSSYKADNKTFAMEGHQ